MTATLLRISVVLMVLGSGCVHCHQLFPVVLDVDPGIDDAMAILTVLGDPSVSVVGITCVRGNANVQTGIVNLYKILYAVCRMEIPVYTGHNYGLIASPSGDNYFGKDGFADLGDELKYDPKWVSAVKTEHAASFLARVVSESPGQITVLATGPLTNLGLALELNPQFLNQTRKVIILGGSIKGSGNAAPGVEFNFYNDPDAASVVLERAASSGTAVTLVPMETITDCDLGMKWRLEELAKVNTTAMSFLNTLETKHWKLHPWATARYTPYDTYAAVALVNPQSINSTQKIYGLVETGGYHTRGVLLLDYLKFLKKHTNLEIITSFKKTEIQNTVIRNLSSYKNCTNYYKA